MDPIHGGLGDRLGGIDEALEDDDARESIDGDALTDIVDEDINGLDDLPEGRDRDSVLEYWSSIGGSWEECAADLSDEFDAGRAKRLSETRNRG